MSVAEMGVSLYAANAGFLDSLEVKKVRDFESALLSFMKSEESDLMAKINQTGDFSDEIKNGVHSAIERFIKTSSW
jgi:F-type H+-transporting ATPase subunit alpha